MFQYVLVAKMQESKKSIPRAIFFSDEAPAADAGGDEAPSEGE